MTAGMSNPIWTPPTYRSAYAIEGDPAVRCPRCGRTTQASMLLDVSAVPMPARVKGERFWCDACCSRAAAHGTVTRAQLYAALDAPPEVLAAAADGGG